MGHLSESWFTGNHTFYLSILFQVQRLPCLHSSNLMSDTLTGKLDTIEFDDVLNGRFSISIEYQRTHRFKLSKGVKHKSHPMLSICEYHLYKCHFARKVWALILHSLYMQLQPQGLWGLTGLFAYLVSYFIASYQFLHVSRLFKVSDFSPPPHH